MVVMTCLVLTSEFDGWLRMRHASYASGLQFLQVPFKSDLQRAGYSLYRLARRQFATREEGEDPTRGEEGKDPTRAGEEGEDPTYHTRYGEALRAGGHADRG